MINVIVTGLRILRVVRANKTAQGDVTSPDTAELMKDWVHKSVSCQSGHVCTWSPPLMPLTEAEIECHLWSPGRKCSGAFNYYSYNCISFFAKKPSFILFFFFLPLSFHQHISLFTEQWKGTGAVGTEFMAYCDGEVRGNHATFPVCPNHDINSPW